VRILYLTDRLSQRGGADLHLLCIIAAVTEAGNTVTVAYGRAEPGVRLPARALGVRVKGLGSPVSTNSRLTRLAEHLQRSDVVHVQNVMNPVPLAMAVRTGHAVVTV
jgi:hypothetical protein